MNHKYDRALRRVTRIETINEINDALKRVLVVHDCTGLRTDYLEACQDFVKILGTVLAATNEI